MKSKALATAVAFILTAGCATPIDNRLAWEIKPVVAVRHGMMEAMASIQLGRHLQSQGDFAAAENAYSEALAADPRNADGLYALGSLYAERGELDRSAAAFRRMTELTPERAYLYNNIGYALYLQGHHAEAAEALRIAVLLDPAYDRAWVNLEKVAQEGGMTELASLAAQRTLTEDMARQTTIIAQADGANLGASIQDQRSEEAPLSLANVIGSPATVVTSVSETTTPSNSPTSPAEQSATIATGPNMPVPIRLAKVPIRPAVIESIDGAGRQHGAHSPIVQASLSGRDAAPVVQLRVNFSSPAPATTGRLEVSNANGVNRFATRVGKQLNDEGVKVKRITNYTSFQVKRSMIEYQTSYMDAALAIRDRLRMDIALKEARLAQRGVDVRLVLGRDTVGKIGPMNTAGVRKPPVVSQKQQHKPVRHAQMLPKGQPGKA
jgi:Tfp pilus assembly protein PilF